MASAAVLSFKSAMEAKVASLYSGNKLVYKTSNIVRAIEHLDSTEQENRATVVAGQIFFQDRQTLSMFVRGFGDILSVVISELKVAIKE